MRTTVRSLLASFRGMSPARRALLVVLALSAGLMLFGQIAKRPATIDRKTTAIETGSSEIVDDNQLKSEWQRLKESSRLVSPGSPAAPIAGINGGVDATGMGSPLISHAAELAVATKEFSHSRSTLEDILERHHGYAAKLRMVGRPAGSTLTATLRVPSSEFTSTVTDLKTLGSVEREEETADEITQQRADLEARLTNAQNTLQRLQGMLAKKDGEGEPRELQRQLLAVNSEIARLEAERIAWQHRTIFANVLLSLREEIPSPVESFGSQFRKAALAGLSDALNSLSAIVLLVISYGPVILIWTLLLFFPVRWMWRMWRPAHKTDTTHAAQTT